MWTIPETLSRFSENIGILECLVSVINDINSSKEEQRIVRPKQVYIGYDQREYEPIEKRINSLENITYTTTY